MVFKCTCRFKSQLCLNTYQVTDQLQNEILKLSNYFALYFPLGGQQIYQNLKSNLWFRSSSILFCNVYVRDFSQNRPDVDPQRRRRAGSFVSHSLLSYRCSQPTNLQSEYIGCCFNFNILTLEVGWLHLDVLQCDSAMLLVSSCVPVITWLCSRVTRFQSRLGQIIRLDHGETSRIWK